MTGLPEEDDGPEFDTRRTPVRNIVRRKTEGSRIEVGLCGGERCKPFPPSLLGSLRVV